jgi:hypothetical protein
MGIARAYSDSPTRSKRRSGAPRQRCPRPREDFSRNTVSKAAAPSLPSRGRGANGGATALEADPRAVPRGVAPRPGDLLVGNYLERTLPPPLQRRSRAPHHAVSARFLRSRRRLVVRGQLVHLGCPQSPAPVPDSRSRHSPRRPARPGRPGLAQRYGSCRSRPSQATISRLMIPISQ